MDTSTQPASLSSSSPPLPNTGSDGGKDAAAPSAVTVLGGDAVEVEAAAALAAANSDSSRLEAQGSIAESDAAASPTLAASASTTATDVGGAAEGALASDAPLDPEELERRNKEAQSKKAEGNDRFAHGDLAAAIDCYTAAIALAPAHAEAHVFYANRAACYLRTNDYEPCIEDCTKALEINPQYCKALLRRAKAREGADKLDQALEDYKAVLVMEPGDAQAQEATRRLPPLIEQQRERLKTEMMGKLKELGNMVLRPFGLSTSNFNMVQDPATGSYSVQFKQ